MTADGKRAGTRVALAAASSSLLLWTPSAASVTSRARATAACGNPVAAPAYTRRVLRALGAGRDVWGEALIAAEAGPTYESAGRYLEPLLLARAPRKRKLTESGVYYVPIADPPGPQGAGSVALHVADGSQVLADRVGGPSLTISVGRRGTERYGSCLARLAQAHLRDGYLPIVETEYTDGAGVRYRQESFSTRGAAAGALSSYVWLAADATGATGDTTVRLAPSAAAGARASPATVELPRGSTRDVYAVWLHGRSRDEVQLIDEGAYRGARDGLARRWEKRLSDAMQISVPERRVEDAERALLVQNLLLGWRYSVGNPYEEFSFPEGPDVAQVMGEQGFADVERAILEASLTRPSTGYASWKRGERLLVSAAYFRLYRDRGYVDSTARVLGGYVDALEHALGRSGPPILARERFSADIPDLVYGLHAQAVAWAGLRAMAAVWSQTGHDRLAGRSRALAVRLESGLRTAVRASERRLPDGSLFLPARLLGDERPYDSLVEARSGSYWNLVMPFALSSGLFAPGSVEARGALRYLLRHGSRLLGLVRAGAYALYGRNAPFPVSGTDQVYGVNVARFLADNDRPDQLVLSLYGQLAAAMTPGTFIAGEGASVAPLGGRRYRAMYLPPNSASNAAFLETLRLMLVHETTDSSGEPDGLELAYATPRAWLRPGSRIAVGDAPTSFGRLSFSITVADAAARVRIEGPDRARPRRLTVRLRLPGRGRITGVSLHGQPFRLFDAATGTIDASGLHGPVELDVRFAKRG